jgi:molybdenum cofactor cytidylyltransferase
MKTGVLILAAGAATRMQRAKMLLPFADTTILKHIIQQAKSILPCSICLVSGCYHTEIIKGVDAEKVAIVFNENWQDGMASSIKKGMAFLLQTEPLLNAVLIVVSDQPYINANLLQQMIALQIASGKGIVAAEYKGVFGTPVLFTESYFIALQQLTGDKGARSIVQNAFADMASIDFALGEIDIDTPEDYERLCLKLNK